MQYFLDLENVAPSFYKKFGLIPLDEATAESMAHNGAKRRTFDMVEPAFVTIEVEEL